MPGNGDAAGSRRRTCRGSWIDDLESDADRHRAIARVGGLNTDDLDLVEIDQTYAASPRAGTLKLANGDMSASAPLRLGDSESHGPEPRRARGPFSQAVEEGGLAFDFDVSSLESFRTLLYFKVHRLAFE